MGETKMVKRFLIGLLLVTLSVFQIGCGAKIATLSNGSRVNLDAVQNWRPANADDLPLLEQDPVFSMLTPALLAKAGVNPAHFNDVKKCFVYFFSIGDNAVPVFNINMSIVRGGLRAYFVDGWKRDDMLKIQTVTGTITHGEMRQATLAGLQEFTQRNGIPVTIVGSVSDANIVFDITEKGVGEEKNILGETSNISEYRSTRTGLYYADHVSKGILLYNWQDTVNLKGFSSTDEKIVLGAKLNVQLQKVTVHEGGHGVGINHVPTDIDLYGVMSQFTDSSYFWTQDPTVPAVINGTDGWRVGVDTTHDVIGTSTDETIRSAVQVGRELLAQS